MSSVESASMSSSEVSEKGPIDFGVKAVSLKSQTDSSRLLPTGVPLRTLPSPTISRQTSAYGPQHPVIPVLGNIPQKTVSFNRVTPGSSPSSSGMSSGTAVTAKPPLSTSTGTSTTPTIHATATYLLPRGSTQGSPNLGPRGPPALGRANVSLQPVSSVQTLVRTQTPIGVQTGPVNHVRAPSPGNGPPRTVVAARATVSAGKPGAQQRSDAARPIVLPSTPARPLSLAPTAQLHIAGDKTMKVPVGSVAQVLPIRPTTFCSVPAFVGQNQATTILQRTDGVGVQSAPATVLTTAVRLTPPLAPMLSTQRVAVSVGTRLTMQQHVTPSPRGPAQGLTNRGVGPPGGPPGPSKVGVPSVASSTILTTGRLAYATGQVVTSSPPVSRTNTQGTMAPVSGKPMPAGPTVVTSGARMPMANHLQTGQPSGGKPRFGGVRPQNPGTAAASSIPQQSMPQGGLLVHSQLMVSTGNHVTGVRPALVTTPGAKVIQQSLPGSIQLTPAPVVSKSSIQTTSATSPSPCPPNPPSSSHLTSVISKQPDVYKLSPAISMSRLCAPQPKGYPLSPAPPPVSSAEAEQQQQLQQSQTSTVFIPASHRANPSPGLLSPQTSVAERPPNAPTLSTYTLPSGASYFYEAPSGYQLATDAPLVARPLSPDAPLVSRQLSTEGPLIARPYTPGLIATSQAMRFNPVMIVEPGVAPSSSGFPAVTSSSSEATSGAAPGDPAKLTSSPRPSILRKRDNDGNVNLKVVKNLSAALSGSASRSRTPSPPTPPSSLHLETNQTGTDIGPSSNGSTTISATSSPGPEDAADPDRPQEMSPRKKPRKQLLNDANDSIDMEFISEERLKKEKEAASRGAGAEPSDSKEGKVYVVKRPTNVSLLRTYKHSWKARNNHFQRYADVKVREERRPSVTELSSQRQIVQRVKGWKIYHLSTQFEDLSDMESCVLDRLSTIFKAMDTNLGKECEKDVNRVNELIMGNIQRSKVIRDQMTEAKLQMMKGFDHKVHVSEIISRCASKRNFKKRDKY